MYHKRTDAAIEERQQDPRRTAFSTEGDGHMTVGIEFVKYDLISYLAERYPSRRSDGALGARRLEFERPQDVEFPYPEEGKGILSVQGVRSVRIWGADLTGKLAAPARLPRAPPR